MKNPKYALGLMIICLVYLGIGLYKLDLIPGEWFGDISIVHEYVMAIGAWHWPWYYSLSAGPLYHYLIAPLIAIGGVSYFSYKVASVLVGLAGVISTFFMVREVMRSSWWGLVGAAILTVSFWFLAWARLGNSQILIVALSATMLWSAAAWRRRRRQSHLLIGVVVSSLGMFVYPQSWMLPVVFALLILLAKPKFVHDKGFVPALLIAGAFAFVWITLVATSREVMTGGYIGAKIWPAFSSNPDLVFKNFTQHLLQTVGMLHGAGDNLFRVNVPKTAQLDFISGGLFLIGMLYWLVNGGKWGNFFVWGSMALFILPSISPALPLGETPSSGRTIAVLPLVILLTTMGVSVAKKYLGWGFFIAVMMLIGVSNMHKYFVEYPMALPNNNSPYARMLASYVDALPDNTAVIMTSCCWGEWGQPEPKAIYYQLKQKKYRENLLSVTDITCEQLPKEGEVVIFGHPIEHDWIASVASCRPNNQVVTKNDAFGEPAFTAVHLH